MNSNNKVRLGVIGLGAMGSRHAQYIASGEVSRCELAAVCDPDESRVAKCKDVAGFTDFTEIIRSGLVDAVLIATPHYLHTELGIAALEGGLHVLVEKPISVHIADCNRLIAARRSDRQVFAAMFQMRVNPVYLKIKRLIDSGELGDIIRVNWTATDWFRPEAYYASGGWRATWKGEGGGVLLNQCSHQLDLLQWICGMPSRIRAFCGLGKWHSIEVEDQVTAYMEFTNGATGVFITGTGESPGTNRFEIAGDRGRIVLENGKISFLRNEVPTSEFSATTGEAFGKPDFWNVEIPVAGGDGGSHMAITQNFVDAIH